MKQELIVKDNKLLQQPLYKTSMELKIFSMVLLKIRENPESDIFSVNVRALMEQFEGTHENYTYLKSVAKKMFGAIDLNPSEKGFDLNVIFTKIEVNHQGIMNFKLNPDIKFYVLNLTANFTQYYFENIAKLKSSFSIRIYEMMKQYEKIGTRKIELINLRHFLNISDDKFIKYNDFKRKVILIAQKELKEKTDVYFEFQEIKQSRKIVEIKFLIFKNKNGSNKDKNETNDFEKKIDKKTKSSLSEKQKNLRNQLINKYNFSEKVADELIISINVEQIENNIAYTEQEYLNGKINKNVSGYLLNAIKNNYVNNTNKLLSCVNQEDNTANTKPLNDKIEKLKSKFSSEFGQAEREKFLNSLCENEKEELLKHILQEFQDDSQAISMIKKKGLNSPVAGATIIRNIPNFEERKQEFITKKLKEAGF